MGVARRCGLRGVARLRGRCHSPGSGSSAGKMRWHGIEDGALFLAVSLEGIAGKGSLEGLTHQLTQFIGLWQQKDRGSEGIVATERDLERFAIISALSRD